MAQSQRMTKYVHKQDEARNSNVHRGREQALTKLKMDPTDPSRPAAPTAQQRVNGKAQGVIHSDSHEEQPAENRRQPFFSTDADSIDMTSTTSSPKHDSRPYAGQRKQQSHGPQTDAEPRDSGNEEEEENDDDDDVEVLVASGNSVSHPGDALQAGGRPRSRAGVDAVQDRALANGVTLPPMKGDSYPDTTSGHPSVSDHDDLHDRQAPVSLQTASIPAGMSGLPTRGTRLAFPLQNLAMHGKTRHTEYPAQQEPISQSAAKHLSTLRPTGDLDDIGADFTFTPPASLHHPRTSQTLEGNASVLKQPGATQVDPQREHIRTAIRVPQPQRRPRLREESPRLALPQPQPVKQLKETKGGKGGNPTPVGQFQPSSPQREYQQRVHPGQVEYVDFPVRGSPSGYGYTVGDMSFEQLSATISHDLDYDFDELHKMTFEELQAAPFDEDPSAQEAPLTNVQQNDSLLQKLHSASDSQLEDQERLITSLTLEQWEEAGEWFVDQFGEIMKRLKAARQDKRKLAGEFENEIQRRHKEVVKKRKLTDMALEEMKESGGKVLQATPTKARRSK